MPPTPYYNPVDDVLEGRIGRKLKDKGGIPRSFEHYFEQLQYGEVMYIGLTGIPQPNKVVVYAHTEQWFDDAYYRLYLSHGYSTFDVYALPAEAVEA